MLRVEPGHFLLNRNKRQFVCVVTAQVKAIWTCSGWRQTPDWYRHLHQVPRRPGVLLPSHILQPILEDPEAIPRPDGICNRSRVSWVYPEVSSLLGIPEMPLQGGVQMPDPPQPAAFSAEEQPTHSLKLVPDTQIRSDCSFCSEGWWLVVQPKHNKPCFHGTPGQQQAQSLME